MKPKKSSNPGSSQHRTAPLPSSSPSNEQIAALAHALWIDRGRPEGRDLEHWFEAERQLRGVVEPLGNEDRLDPEMAPAARVDRELERMVSPPERRSVTAL